jgi:hypothetical protein
MSSCHGIELSSEMTAELMTDIGHHDKLEHTDKKKNIKITNVK